MENAKSHIIRRLQSEILSLQGLSPLASNPLIKLGPINAAFPNKSFPLRAIHEFISTEQETLAATSGFIAGITAALMHNGGATVWISTQRNLFPPALAFFHLDPSKIIFIDIKNHRDALWAFEETLKCKGLAAVIAEIPELHFTSSRRLQLAVEKSGVTGFIIRHRPKQTGTTTCLTRWKIQSLPSETGDALPGIGFPKWKVALLKVRNGQPGQWELQWSKGQFRALRKETSPLHQLQIKTG